MTVACNWSSLWRMDSPLDGGVGGAILGFHEVFQELDEILKG